MGRSVSASPRRGVNVQCVSLILLVEVGLGYGEEAAVSVSSHGEDEGLPREHSQVTHHLPRVGHKEQGVLLAVYHALINMERPRDDELHTRILQEMGRGSGRNAQ